jgi:signal peptidase I
MLKKIILNLINTLSVIVIVCAVVVLLTVLLTGSDKAPSLMGYSVFRVMTGSMEPSISLDSMIVVQKTDPAELKEGDVISFFSSDPSLDGAVNTHRIVSVEEDNGYYTFTTKGDANNVEDHYLTTEDDLIGKVVFSSLFLGKLVRLVSNPLIFVPVIILPLLIMLVANLWQTISLAKKIAREEEEKAVRDALDALREKRKTEDERNKQKENPDKADL